MTFEAETYCLNSLQTLTTQELLEDALTCNLVSCEHCVLSKEIKVKFGTYIHRTEGLLDLVNMNFWGPTKTASLEGYQYFVYFVNFSRHYWVYPMS